MTARTWDSLRLSAGHVATLQASAISPDVAGEREYVSIENRKDPLLDPFGSMRLPVPGILVPIWGTRPTDEPVGHTYRPDTPTGKLKYLVPNGARNHVDVPRRVRDRLGDPAIPLWITEGAKKCDAAASIGLACVSLAGVWNFRGVNEAGGKTAVPDFDAVALNNREVLIAYDSDATVKHPVRMSIMRLHGLLESWGAQVRVVVLPGDSGGSKQGLDDAIAAGMTEEDLRGHIAPDFIDESKRVLGGGNLGGGKDDPRPRVDVTRPSHLIANLQQVVNDGAVPDLYIRGGRLARLTANTPPVIHEVTDGGLAALFSTHTIPYVQTETGPAETAVTVDTAARVNYVGRWGLPPLDGVVTMPVLRPDGTLLQTPGYDPDTRLFYAPDVDMPDVPDTPNAEWVDRAKQLLFDEMLADFPWEGDADKANYAAALFIPVLRPYVGPVPTPLIAITAHQPGSGKTLLKDVLGNIHGVATKTLPFADEELRKAITSLLRDTSTPIVALDNVPDYLPVGSAVLAQLLTQYEWVDRVLATNANFAGPNDRLWVTTGNNTRFAGDMAGRVLRVAIDPANPAPEERSGFVIDDLDSWTREHRTELRLALLTLVRAWITGGAPQAGITWRGYTPWLRNLGGLLDFLEVPGLAGNRDSVRAADEDHEQWFSLAQTWHREYGEEPQRLRDVIDNPELAETLPEGKRGKTLTTQGLSKMLSTREGRFYGELRFLRIHDPHTKANLWAVVTRPETGTESGPDDQGGATPPGDPQGDTDSENDGGGQGPFDHPPSDNAGHSDDQPQSESAGNEGPCGERAGNEEPLFPAGMTCENTSFAGNAGNETHFRGRAESRERNSLVSGPAPGWIAKHSPRSPRSPQTPGHTLFDAAGNDAGNEADGTSKPRETARGRTLSVSGARIRYIGADDDPAGLLHLVDDATTVAVDTETTGTDPHADGFAVRLVQFATATEAFVIPAEERADLVRTVIATAEHLVCHNAQFDLVALHRGLDIPLEETTGKTTDIRDLSRILDPLASGKQPHSLANMARRHLDDPPDHDTVLHTRFRQLGIAKRPDRYALIPIDDPVYTVYAALDAAVTARLHHHLAPQLPEQLAARVSRLAGLQAGMHTRGHLVDPDHAGKLITEFRSRIDTKAPVWERFGLSSPYVRTVEEETQLEKLLVDTGIEPRRTPKSKRLATGNEDMTAYAQTATGDVAELLAAIIECRGWDKYATTVQSYFLDQRAADGRLHPTLNAVGSKTGRMSASDPNLQNVPRDEQMRGCLTADPGHVLISADLSQIELRVSAALSESRWLINGLSREIDLHEWIAKELYGDAYERERHRQVGKSTNYACCYGAGGSRVAIQAGVPREVGESAASLFHRTFPEVRRYADKLSRQTTNVTPYGRRLPVPADREYRAINHMIQSVACDLFIDGVLRMADAGLADKLWLLVHDEVIVQAPQDEAEGVARTMEDALQTEFREVPISGEAVEIGNRWLK